MRDTPKRCPFTSMSKQWDDVASAIGSLCSRFPIRNFTWSGSGEGFHLLMATTVGLGGTTQPCARRSVIEPVVMRHAVGRRKLMTIPSVALDKFWQRIAAL